MFCTYWITKGIVCSCQIHNSVFLILLCLLSVLFATITTFFSHTAYTVWYWMPNLHSVAKM